MARFRGTVSGNRGEVSRLGHADSGLQTKCNGWELGVNCYAEPDPNFPDRDRIGVHVTSGSGAKTSWLLVGYAVLDSGGEPTFKHLVPLGRL